MTEYKLFVDDNYHYMEEEERYCAGSFTSYDEALAKAKEIVDEFLEQGYEPGMTSKELYGGYVGFGEDPFIIPPGDPPFSAWNYARERCKEFCRDEDAIASVLRYPDWPAELADFRAVLLAGLRRVDLGSNERKDLEALCRAIEGFPNALPRENSWYWFRLEREGTAYTVYLYWDRFELRSVGTSPGTVDWEVRLRGSGRRDRRLGDIDAAFRDMRRAAQAADCTLKVAVR
jgi:hypothetical protein